MTKTKATRAEWLAIAAACEAATGPDRGLDARIAFAMDNSLSSDNARMISIGIQPYTASFDAIATAIGSGPDWCAENDGRAEILVHSPLGEEHDRVSQGRAATPALALCAAFARAMAEKEGGR